MQRNRSDRNIAAEKGLPNPNRSDYSANMWIVQPSASHDGDPDDGDGDALVTEAEWLAAERELIAAGMIDDAGVVE